MAGINLSVDLSPIYEIELTLGNMVARVDQPAGTECPLAVVFKCPLHHDEISKSLSLPATVRYWECTDSHYAIESGYQCEKSRHTISGPLR